MVFRYFLIYTFLVLYTKFRNLRKVKINKIYLEDTMVRNYIFDSIGILLVFALCSALFSIASVNIIRVSLCQRPL